MTRDTEDRILLLTHTCILALQSLEEHVPMSIILSRRDQLVKDMQQIERLVKGVNANAHLGSVGE